MGVASKRPNRCRAQRHARERQTQRTGEGIAGELSESGPSAHNRVKTPVGEGLDPVRRRVEVGEQALQAFANCQHGFTFVPTQHNVWVVWGIP